MLHACGQHINLNAYHKHSWYLIRHGELLGYSEIEHLMVAAIARYHRRSLPKKRHEAWQSLQTREHRRIVTEMALLLRLAVALDRRPETAVKAVHVMTTSENCHLELTPQHLGQSLSLEQWSVESCSQVVREVAGIQLIVTVRDE